MGEVMELIKKIQTNEKLAEYVCQFCEFEIREYRLNRYRDKTLFLDGDSANYDLVLIGIDNAGGKYCLMNNKYIGYADSEGSCDRLANSIEDFVQFILNCPFWYNRFGRKNFLDSFESFQEEMAEQREDFRNEETSEEASKLFEEFLRENNLNDNLETIYKKLMEALTAEPKFVIKNEPEDYSWDNFYKTKK